MQKAIQKVLRFKKILIICVLLVSAFVAGTGFPQSIHHSQQVLGASIHITPTPTPTVVPTAAPITIINNIIVPTQSPTVVTQNPTPTPTQSPASPTLTPLAQPTQEVPTPTLTPTPTATPAAQNITIDIEYAGEHAESVYTTTITSHETAWQAVSAAIGLPQIQYTDYGGDLGIFITGFNGITASANQYYDFQVNGASSSVGVSSYVVNNQDVLKFVLTNF